MKARHGKLDGYRATLPAMRPFSRLPTVLAPLPPPPSSLLCSHTYALLPTAEPPQIPAPQDGAQANRAADRSASTRPPPPPSPCEKPHGLIPRPAPLLNRLAAAPHLFHPFPSLPLPQHPQRLPSLGYPSIYLLLVELVRHFRWMLPSYLQWPCHTYLALGGVRIRLTENGIKVGGFFLKGGKGSLFPSRGDALNGRYLLLLRGPGGIRRGR